MICSNYQYQLLTKFNHCAFWPSSLSLQKTQHRHNVFVSKCRYVYYIKAKCRCKKKQKSVLSWFKSCSNIFNAANVFKNEEEMYYLPLQNQNKHKWNQALSSHLVGKYNEYNLYLAEKCTSDIIVYLSMYVLQQHDDTMLCFAIVFGKETTTKKL